MSKYTYQLEPHDIHELKHREIRKSSKGNVHHRNVIGTIEEFAFSDYDCCKICTCDTNRKAHIECTILRRSVKLGDFTNVKVVLRGEEVYLVKKSSWDKA